MHDCSMDNCRDEYWNSHRNLSLIHIYKSTGIASRLGISGAPAVAFIKDGKLAGVLTEGITEEALEAGIR